jgi:hypothetical protein
VQAKAVSLARNFCEQLQLPFIDFKASNGWFAKFKDRFQLGRYAMSGDKLDADKESVQPFIEKLRTIIADGGYELHHIYNVDETGLMYKQQPKYTLAPKTFSRS